MVTVLLARPHIISSLVGYDLFMYIWM